jgi:hypothetical protein
MSSPDGAPEDRWQYRFTLVGLLIVAVLMGSFFFFYGNALLNFLMALFGPPRLPGT